uniref:Uncharacterized protein n=1 Tax=Nelumbo nucifera TaxID=4432 RepID=A0A822Z204_NELNU|nr:TPA_asm: hypothetical protein HUJ06_012855 [Nelumbo nucifera]
MIAELKQETESLPIAPSLRQSFLVFKIEIPPLECIPIPIRSSPLSIKNFLIEISKIRTENPPLLPP